MIDYASPGVLTRLGSLPDGALDGLGSDPVQVCRLVNGLVPQPSDAAALGAPSGRLAEKQIRPAEALLRCLLAMRSAPVTTEPDRAAARAS
ncbi:MAG: hypothetical protein ACJ74O_00190 [Frankiaceae bacterium]